MRLYFKRQLQPSIQHSFLPLAIFVHTSVNIPGTSQNVFQEAFKGTCSFDSCRKMFSIRPENSFTYTPQTFSCLMFSDDIEREHWPEIGQYNTFTIWAKSCKYFHFYNLKGNFFLPFAVKSLFIHWEKLNKVPVHKKENNHLIQHYCDVPLI